MMRISAICNQKGGVGKTTTTAALSAGLSLKGYKVLAIDIDPQCNLSYGMGADTNGISVYEALKKEAKAKDIIQHTKQGDIIPSSPRLTGADKIFFEFGMEYLLSEALEPLRDEYDYIIIDNPPQIGVLTVNSFVACTDIIIPLTSDIYAMQGLSQLLSNIGIIKKRQNPNIQIAGILLVKYSSRSVLSRDLKESIEASAGEMGTKVYKTMIRENVSIRESQAQRTSIFEYAPNSNAAIDYQNFINEYLMEGDYKK